MCKLIRSTKDQLIQIIKEEFKMQIWIESFYILSSYENLVEFVQRRFSKILKSNCWILQVFTGWHLCWKFLGKTYTTEEKQNLRSPISVINMFHNVNL